MTGVAAVVGRAPPLWKHGRVEGDGDSWIPVGNCIVRCIAPPHKGGGGGAEGGEAVGRGLQRGEGVGEVSSGV